MNPRRLVFLALLCPSVSAHAAEVTMQGWLYRELFPEQPRKPDPLVFVPWATQRDVVLEPTKGGVIVHATWEIAAPDGGFFSGILVGPEMRLESATVDGKPASAQSGPSGVVLTTAVSGRARVEVVGFIDGDADQGIGLQLLPAVRGTVTVLTDREAVVSSTSGAIATVENGFLSGASQLRVAVHDKAPPREKAPLIVANVALGVTISDGDVSGRARVDWSIRQGEVDELSFRMTGIGADLGVTGEGIASWRREGDRVVVKLDNRRRSSVVANVQWSVALAAGEEVRVELPTLEPEGAFRTETSLQLAREDAVEVVPELPGWVPVAVSSLPKAESLVSGTPTGAFRLSGANSGSLSVLRFAPVEQPAAVVDVASTQIASNEEGRLLVRGYFTIRNERAAALRVIPPPGVEILGVQVQGSPVVPGDDGAGGWLIPLPRSVETVDGLLSFPVEVIGIGKVEGWSKHRRERDLALWTLDAPIAVQRVSFVLPPGYRSKAKIGDNGVVADFTEGESIAYGLAVGDTAAAVVDAKFSEALSAYMENDFEGAQQKLDELRDMGGQSENVSKLQGNLDILDVDVVNSSATRTDEDSALARRVKDQAKARALDDVILAEDKYQEAKAAERAGDYERASSAYKEAEKVTGNLAGLDQTEAVELRAQRESASSGYAMVEKKKMERQASNAPTTPPITVTTKTPAPAKPEPSTYAFQDEKPPDPWQGDDGEISNIGGAYYPEYNLPVVEPPPPDVAANYEPAPVDPSTTSGSVVITEDFLQNIPTGRTYQSAVQMVAGVTGGRHRDRNAPAPEKVEAYRQIADGTVALNGQTPLGADSVILNEYTVDGRVAPPEMLDTPAEMPEELLASPTTGDELLYEVRANASYVTGLEDGEGYSSYGIGTAGYGAMGGGGAGYGVGYGSISGTVGGTLSGRVYSVDASESVVVARKRGSFVPSFGGKGGGKRGKAARDAAVGAFDADMRHVLTVGGDEAEEPIVTAAAMTVIIPELGPTVRYQALLLTPGATPTIHLDATKAKDPRSSR